MLTTTRKTRNCHFRQVSCESGIAWCAATEIGVRIGRGPRWSASQRRTSSGLEVRLVLLMSDHRRKEFESVEAIRRMKGVRLGIGAGTYFAEKRQESFPQPRPGDRQLAARFFREKRRRCPAGFRGRGSAWTLALSGLLCCRANPFKGFPVFELGEFLDHWVRLKKADGTVDRLRDHWILGRDAIAHRPRWSVLRNVLRWVP